MGAIDLGASFVASTGAAVALAGLLFLVPRSGNVSRADRLA